MQPKPSPSHMTGLLAVTTSKWGWAGGGAPTSRSCRHLLWEVGGPGAMAPSAPGSSNSERRQSRHNRKLGMALCGCEERQLASYRAQFKGHCSHESLQVVLPAHVGGWCMSLIIGVMVRVRGWSGVERSGVECRWSGVECEWSVSGME